MIAHLHDRKKSLEPFGWKGREAEWIALVCLHSGVFTRAQFCYFFDAVSDRKRAFRFVRDLVDRGLAVEDALPNKRGNRSPYIRSWKVRAEAAGTAPPLMRVLPWRGFLLK